MGPPAAEPKVSALEYVPESLALAKVPEVRLSALERAVVTVLRFILLVARLVIHDGSA